MKPINMKTWEVRAVLDNHKTVMRRVVKPRYYDSVFEMFRGELCEASPYKPPINNGDGTTTYFVRRFVPCKPPHLPGDILYVRETWCQPASNTYWYKADSTVQNILWRPSIHMPREAARIFLRVTGVRLERLWNMTNNDLVNDFGLTMDAIVTVGWKGLGREVWDSTLKPKDRAIYGWEANPWVWVIEFKRISREEAE